MDNRTILQLYAKWQKLPVKHFQLPHSNAVREQQSAAEAPGHKIRDKYKSPTAQPFLSARRIHTNVLGSSVINYRDVEII